MDNFILNDENEVYYECGYSCDNVIFLSLGNEKFFITDGRYTTDAKENAKAEVITTKDLLKTTKEILLKNRVKKLKIDPTKWDYKSYTELQKVTILQDETNLSHKKRMIKTEKELEIIQEAVEKGALAFEEFKNYAVNPWRSPIFYGGSIKSYNKVFIFLYIFQFW